jgi:hypothetical protein
MSVNYYGKCDNCGKSNQRVTFEVRVHDIPGTKVSEEWCLERVQGNRTIKQDIKRNRAKSREVKKING